MKAQEMFEELDYYLRTDYKGNLIKQDNYIFYDKYSYSGTVVEHITFYLVNNPKSGFVPHYSTSKARNSACGWKMKSVDIVPKLHKAITQQIKELGWV